MRDEVGFHVNGSHFPAYLELVSAHLIIMQRKCKLGLGNFLSSIVLPFRNACTAELCGILCIMKLIQYLVLEANLQYEIIITEI